MKKNLVVRSIMFLVVGSVFLTSVPYLMSQENPYLLKRNWTGSAMQAGGLVDNPEGITKDGKGLRFQGFHLGKEAQYSLIPEMAKDLENKLVNVTLTLNGEFPGADSSFLALVVRGSSPNTIFWSQPCYALLFKSGQIEVQKHGKGTNPNLIYRYSDFPALGFSSFPKGKPVNITYGVVTKGHFPTMIVKVNGVDICSVLDNRYGQTVRPNEKNVFIVGVIATNKEIPGDTNSHSSVTLSDFTVQ